jgi:hypothetical protein
VVAAVVLDLEVAVAVWASTTLAQPPLDLGLLVAELVGVGDADAADGADGERVAQLGPPSERSPGGDDPAGPEEAEVLQRQVEVGEDAVVASSSSCRSAHAGGLLFSVPTSASMIGMPTRIHSGPRYQKRSRSVRSAHRAAPNGNSGTTSATG